MRRPFWSHLYRTGGSEIASAKPSNSDDFADLFHVSKTPQEAASTISKALATKLAKILSIANEEELIKKPLHSFGVDSLLAVEISNWFASKTASSIEVFDVVGGANTATLGRLAVERSAMKPAQWFR